MDYTAAILRNKGVQVEVAVLIKDEDGHAHHAKDSTGAIKTAQRWVRFDANAIADIEEQFGNLAGFETASRATPFLSIRKALAIIWDVSPREAGLMMMDGEINTYSTAIGVSLSVANGVDPMQALRLLKVGVTAGKQITEERTRVMEETLVEAEAELEKKEKEEKAGEAGDGETEDAGDAAKTDDNQLKMTIPEALDSSPTDASTGNGGANGGSEPAAVTTSSGPTPSVRLLSPSGATDAPKPNSGAEGNAEEQGKVEGVGSNGLTVEDVEVELEEAAEADTSVRQPAEAVHATS